MSTFKPAGLLRSISLEGEYRLDFFRQDEKIIAKIFHAAQLIKEHCLETMSSETWSFKKIPMLDRLEINRVLNEQASNKAGFQPEFLLDESDEEFEEVEKVVFVAQKQKITPTAFMTISCQDQNIKGSTLIEIVHDTIQDWFGDFVDGACEYEKDLDGPAIYPPRVENNILFIESQKDWVMSLGGWRGMMPQKEVKGFFVYEFIDPSLRGKKFAGVSTFNNGVIFSIKGNRLHLPENFSINGVDVTGYYENQDGRLVYVPSGHTDLSYPQIVHAIELIKRARNLVDSDIAKLQLYLLSREGDFPEWYNLLSPQHLLEITQFLDFLNDVMFGMEASGLNAAIATSLMTLDLIAKGYLSYQTAFKANSDGGFYPYACFGNNKGTYSQRERIVLHKKETRDSLSMKEFRDNPSLSPVALKEAVLIKAWLDFNKLLSKEKSHEIQKVDIKKSIKNLIDQYLWV